MAAFPHLGLSTLPGRAEALLHEATLHAYAPPLAAFAMALALGLIGKAGMRPLLAAAGAGGALAGWAALLPVEAMLRAVLAPRAMADFLLLPAAATVVATAAVGLASPRLRMRAERWVSVALAVLAGWWLAGSTPARPEFWRVWLVVGVAAWLLARSAGRLGPGGQMLAAALALWGGLVVAGASPVWIAAALVAVAAAAAAWCLDSALPPVLAATVAAAADLGTGRLVRGGLNAADLACLCAIAAAWLMPSLQTRSARRLGRASPAAAALGTAALATGVIWLSARFLQR